jgi:hypothetical protein
VNRDPLVSVSILVDIIATTASNVQISFKDHTSDPILALQSPLSALYHLPVLLLLCMTMFMSRALHELQRRNFSAPMGIYVV